MLKLIDIVHSSLNLKHDVRKSVKQCRYAIEEFSAASCTALIIVLYTEHVVYTY